MSGDFKILLVFLLVVDHEEQVEARHNRWGDVDVVAEGLGTIVSTSVGVSGSQDRGTSVESCVDASLSDRDSLLLHSLVNSNLILDLHLVELIDAADAVISEHESTSLNAELSSLVILAHRSGQTCGI